MATPSEYRIRDKRVTTLIATPAISAAAAYTAKDAIGGLITFTNAAFADVGSGIIHSLTVVDNDSEEAPLQVHLFNQTFTASADNAIFSPSDADLNKFIGVVGVVDTDYFPLDDNSVATVTGLNLPFNLVSGGTSLFAQIATETGTPTYTAATDLTIRLGIVKD